MYTSQQPGLDHKSDTSGGPHVEGSPEEEAAHVGHVEHGNRVVLVLCGAAGAGKVRGRG